MSRVGSDVPVWTETQKGNRKRQLAAKYSAYCRSNSTNFYLHMVTILTWWVEDSWEAWGNPKSIKELKPLYAEIHMYLFNFSIYCPYFMGALYVKLHSHMLCSIHHKFFMAKIEKIYSIFKHIGIHISSYKQIKTSVYANMLSI